MYIIKFFCFFYRFSFFFSDSSYPLSHILPNISVSSFLLLFFLLSSFSFFPILFLFSSSFSYFFWPPPSSSFCFFSSFSSCHRLYLPYPICSFFYFSPLTIVFISLTLLLPLPSFRSHLSPCTPAITNRLQCSQQSIESLRWDKLHRKNY